MALVVKNPLVNAGDVRGEGLIPGSEGSHGEGDGNPLQYSSLENSMDRGALVGYNPWGHKESDTTERLTLPLSLSILSKEPYSTPDMGPGFSPKANIKGVNSSKAQASTDWWGDTPPTEVMFPVSIRF